MPGNTFRRSAVNIKGLRLQVKLKNANSPVLCRQGLFTARADPLESVSIISDRQTTTEESGKNEVD